MAVDYNPEVPGININPLPDNTSNISVTRTPYHETGSFRFWCQKVMPLVYDDSLSYYELLCKVVNFLNEVIENVDNLHTENSNVIASFGALQNYVNTNDAAMTQFINASDTQMVNYINSTFADFQTAYNQLQTYVNDYFDNLDVQEEINNKLDAMAESGELSALIRPLLVTYQQQLDLLEARVDTLESNYTPGGTTADAELADIRVAYDAKTYATAGNAVRAQASDLNYRIGLRNNLDLFEIGNINISNTGWNYGGYPVDTRVRTKEGTSIHLRVGDVIGLTDYTNARYYLGWKNSSDVYSTRAWSTENYTVLEEGDYVVLIGNLVDTPQSSSDTLAALFFGYSGIAYNDINTVKAAVNKEIYYKTKAGYYNSDGTIHTPDATQHEVITSLIACEKGDTFYIKQSFSEVHSLWIAYSLFDSYGAFISRTVLVGRNLMSYNTSIAISSDTAKYISFSFRQYSENSLLHVYNVASEGIIPAINNSVNMNTDILATIVPDGIAGLPEINSSLKTVKFHNNTTIIFRDYTKRFRLSETTINCSAINYEDIAIYYDTKTENIRGLKYIEEPSFSEILLALIHFEGNGNTTASMSCPYVIDNKPFGFDLTKYTQPNISLINPNIKSINHRGYNTIAPENTIPAFKLSKQYGFDIVETDIEFTSDKIPVCLHDSTINRTARNSNGTEISSTIYINAITYEQSLAYDFGIWKGAEYAGTKLPTFKEFLTLCKKIGLSAYVELKEISTVTESDITGLCDIAKECGMLDQVTWISFNGTYLGYISNYIDNCRLGYVTSLISDTEIAVAEGLKTNTNYVFIDARVQAVTTELIEDCIEADIPLELWTVDTASYFDTMNPYITGVTSNYLVASYESYIRTM